MLPPMKADTNDITLPQELLDLAEELAEHVHEVWASGRISDGWTYGPVRDDAARKHPCLVPYSDLSETEKDFDRRTSQETLKFILKQGFTLNGPHEPSQSSSDEDGDHSYTRE